MKPKPVIIGIFSISSIAIYHIDMVLSFPGENTTRKKRIPKDEFPFPIRPAMKGKFAVYNMNQTFNGQEEFVWDVL